MFWVLLAIPFTIILLYFNGDNFLGQFKNSIANPEKKQVIKIEDREALTQILKENIGKNVTVHSKDFTCVYQNRLIEDSQKITGKILEVDEEWLNIEFDSRQFIKKDSLDQLIFRIDRINSFFINGNCNS